MKRIELGFKKYKGLSGIYGIRRKISGRIYIGSSIRIGCDRFPSHLYSLRKNDHYNTSLQKDWNESGENAFEFILLKDLTFEIEGLTFSQIDDFLSYYELLEFTLHKELYNKYKVSRNKNLGRKQSEQSKAKSGAASAEYWSDPLNHELASKTEKDRYSRPGERERRSKEQTELWQDPEYKKRQLQLQKEGRKNTPNYLENYLKSMEPHFKKDSNRSKKISKNSRERWQDPVQREIMLRPLTESNRKRSEEAKARKLAKEGLGK